MKIKIIQVGNTKDRYLEKGIAEYLKRISPYAKMEIVELKEEKKSKTISAEICRENEGKKILKQFEERAFTIVLDEKGREMNSEKFAELLETNSDQGRTISFVIGGPFGLSEEVKKRADLVLAFSQMTFTHRMIRLILVEQIYRGLSIIAGKEYHH